MYSKILEFYIVELQFTAVSEIVFFSFAMKTPSLLPSRFRCASFKLLAFFLKILGKFL